MHVILVDASPYLFRSFFSLPKSIVDTAGRPVNAVYGFTTFVAKLIAEQKPSHIAVAFDRHFNQSFRNQFYPPYKAHRDASPKELDAQVDPAVEVMEAIGVTTFIDETHEADDLIATVIHQTWKAGASYTVVSVDKDLAQLVGDRVTLEDPGRKRFDAAGVKAKFGVMPEQMVDYLALVGDAVDNIPGVRGIGPKTAAQLLQKHGSLEVIAENVAKVRDFDWRLSKRLATVSRESPIRVAMNDLRYRGPDEKRVRETFGRLGFKNLQIRVM